jgi:hypothetical protein
MAKLLRIINYADRSSVINTNLIFTLSYAYNVCILTFDTIPTHEFYSQSINSGCAGETFPICF